MQLAQASEIIERTVLVSCMLPAIARVGNDVTEYAAMHYPRMICVTCFGKVL